MRENATAEERVQLLLERTMMSVELEGCDGRSWKRGDWQAVGEVAYRPFPERSDPTPDLWGAGNPPRSRSVGIRASYLLDALKVPDLVVDLEVAGEIDPVVASGGGWRVILMPMRKS